MVLAALNTPAKDATKTDGKGTIDRRQTGIKATLRGLSGNSPHSHNTYKRKLQRRKGAGDTPIYKANLAIGGTSLEGPPPNEGLFLQVSDHGTREKPLDNQNTSQPSRPFVSSPSSKFFLPSSLSSLAREDHGSLGIPAIAAADSSKVPTPLEVSKDSYKIKKRPPLTSASKFWSPYNSFGVPDELVLSSNDIE
ncbi:hypothetical protein BHM03_00032655 [Ensete ventricosum]|nr:hypothetical protein BHM03_00032655 [Ensete ventricosum]